MAETTTTPAKKTKSAGKAKKPKTAPTHPKVSDMVNSAITTLKERGGSSLAAIKKYIGVHYKVDLEKLSPFIRKYLKSAVASGSLVQTKGKGANGSFRIATAGGAPSAAKPKAAKKKTQKPKKEKAASSPKKAAKPKKAAVKKTPKKAAPAKKAKPAAKKAKPAKSAKPKKPKAAAKKASPKKAKK